MAVLPFTSSSDLELAEDFEDGLYAADRNSDRDFGNQSSEQIDEQRSVPYMPSFILPLSEVDPMMRNVRDVKFLPNFQKPTVAILCEPDRESWTGSLQAYRDTMQLFIFTLDLSSTAHPVLSHYKDLPYDCLYIQPSPNLGGLLVVTASTLFHLDQSGKMVGLKVNGWSERTTTNPGVLSLPLWEGASSRHRSLSLADSHIEWIDAGIVSVLSDEKQGDTARLPTGSALLVLKDRSIMSLRFNLDGRTVSSLSIEPISFQAAHDVPQASPSVALALSSPDSGQFPLSLFVGTMLGSSTLYQVQAAKAKSEQSVSATKGTQMDIDVEDEDDLYGDNALGNDSSQKDGKDVAKDLSVWLKATDTLPGLGPLGDVTLAVLQDGQTGQDVVKLVATSGVEPTGGLCHLEDRIQPRQSTLVIDRDTGMTLTGSARPLRQGMIVLDQVAEESPTGKHPISVYEVNADGEASPHQIWSANEAVCEVGWLGGDNYVVVTYNEVSIRSKDATAFRKTQSRLLKADIRQIDLAVDESALTCKGATILLDNGTVSIFPVAPALASNKAGAFLLSEISLPTQTAASYSHVKAFRDNTGALEALQPSAPAQPHLLAGTDKAPAEEEVDYGDDEEEMPMTSADVDIGVDTASASSLGFLGLLTITGSVEFWRLQPEPQLAWRSNSLLDLPARLHIATQDPIVVCSDQEGVNVRDFWIGTVGDCLSIAVVEETGELTIWSAGVTTTSGTTERSSTSVELYFNKSFAKHLGKLNDSTGFLMPPNGELGAAPRPQFRSFHVGPKAGFGGPALAIAGTKKAGWIYKTRKGKMTFSATSHDFTRSLAPLDDSFTGDYLLAGQHGLTISQLPADVCYDLQIPHKLYSTGRQYTRIRPHPSSRCLVAASTVPTPFIQFDTEDGTQVRNSELDPQSAYSKRGCLELFRYDWTEPIDGFEFEQNETVSALELLTLKSSATATGLKDFIGVGTTVYNGEDRPTRGSMYVFEVVEVVASQDDPEANCRLKLLTKDDGKGPVSALADISGYFVVAIGQRMFVRSFEKNESLVNVAFLDVGFLTTSIRRLGSTLLVGDVKKACILVGFQEEPFRLSVFARHFDYNCYVNTADYVVAADSMGFLTTDWRGVLRLLQYDPTSTDAQGQRMTLRTEFQTSTEYSASVTRANGNGNDGEAADAVALSNEVVLCGTNGSLALVRPVGSERLYHAGAALANQMMRNVRHAAALHPRSHRLVRNDAFSRPLYRGVLDGLMLGSGEDQGWGFASRPKRQELVDLAGIVADESDSSAIVEQEILSRLADLFG